VDTPTGREVYYHGVNGPGGSMIEVRDELGTLLGLVTHVVKHSPTGMGWGYMGSGAADCARSLLIAVLDGEAVCPLCEGQTRPGARCSIGCDGGYLDSLPYHDFKSEVVSQWAMDGGWVMARRLIRDWLIVRWAAA
jgi:hypothetical protein